MGRKHRRNGRTWMRVAITITAVLGGMPTASTADVCQETAQLLRSYQGVVQQGLQAAERGQTRQACRELHKLKADQERTAVLARQCIEEVGKEAGGIPRANLLRQAWETADQRPLIRQAIVQYCEKAPGKLGTNRWSQDEVDWMGRKGYRARSAEAQTIDGLSPKARVWYACRQRQGTEVLLESIAIVLTDGAPYAAERQEGQQIAIAWNEPGPPFERFGATIHGGNELTVDRRDVPTLRFLLEKRSRAFVALPSRPGKSLIYEINLRGSQASIQWARRNC